jgi:hypothetical protein
LERAFGDCFLGAAVAFGGEGVLRFAAEAVLLGAELPGFAHGELVIRIPEPVVHHAVDELAVADAVAAARARQVVGCVRHRFHPARDREARVAQQERAPGEHGCLQTGAADLVDRRAGHGVRDARVNRGLAGRCLADARGEDVAHEDFVHLIERHSRALERRFDGERAEARCRE